jgi:hypothetical protein
MVCQFSCGAASAVATKLTLHEFPPEQVLIVNAFIVEEHEDNRRFAADCERWFGHPITLLRDQKYGASTDRVWRERGYMKGLRFVPCSHYLKRQLLSTVSQPGDIKVIGFTMEDDIKVIGFTMEERDRFENLCDHFPEESFSAPLIERNLFKADCLAIIKDAGIELPFMYRIGYDNANCIGCPKGGQSYWQKIREDFPERFAQVQAIQEEIGPGAYFLQFRSGPRKGERMSLAELPPGRGNMADEASFSCSFFCELTKQELSQ